MFSSTVDAAWDGDPVTAEPNQLVSVDASGDDVTVTLPADPPQGTIVGVQLVTDPSGNTVTVDGNGDGIEGESTYDLPSLAQYETVLFAYATGIAEAWTVFVKPAAGGGSQPGAWTVVDAEITVPAGYPILTVDVPSQTITIAGDHAAAFLFADPNGNGGATIHGSTGNDNYNLQVDSAVFGAGITTITFAALQLSDATADGLIAPTAGPAVEVPVPAGSTVLDVMLETEVVPSIRPIARRARSGPRVLLHPLASSVASFGHTTAPTLRPTATGPFPLR